MSSNESNVDGAIIFCLVFLVVGEVFGWVGSCVTKQVKNVDVCVAYCHPAEYTMTPLCICKETPQP